MKKFGLIVASLAVVVIGAVFIKDAVVSLQTGEESQPKADATLNADSLVIRVPADQWLSPRPVSPQEPDGKTSNWFYSIPYTLPKDMKITGFTVDIEGAEDSVLHHVSAIVPDRLPVFCPFQKQQNNLGYQLYSASRNTLDPVQLPADYGLFVSAGEHIVVEFMEHTRAAPHGAHQADENLLPTLVLTMQLDDTATKPAQFVRLRLDDSPCANPFAHQAFSVPVQEQALVRHSSSSPGGSEKFTFPDDGVVLETGANFWPMKGGEQVTGYINNESKWEFQPEAGQQDWEWNIPHQREAVSFAAGDELTLSAQYTNPFTKPVLDASGMLGVYYALDADVAQE